MHPLCCATGRLYPPFPQMQLNSIYLFIFCENIPVICLRAGTYEYSFNNFFVIFFCRFSLQCIFHHDTFTIKFHQTRRSESL